MHALRVGKDFSSAIMWASLTLGLPIVVMTCLSLLMVVVISPTGSRPIASLCVLAVLVGLSVFGMAHTPRTSEGSRLLWPNAVRAFVKRTFDIVLAATLLFVAAPALVLVSICVMADGGLPLSRHRRLGQGGRHFWCFKFRTIVMDPEQVLEEILATDPVRAAAWREGQKSSADLLLTKIGRILRKTSLDKLPQLFNVLRGDMSMVGPRPIVDEELEFYGHDFQAYFSVRPGMTGLWQVSHRSETSHRERVQSDVWYAAHWSFWMDIAILIRTIPMLRSRLRNVVRSAFFDHGI